MRDTRERNIRKKKVFKNIRIKKISTVIGIALVAISIIGFGIIAAKSYMSENPIIQPIQDEIDGSALEYNHDDIEVRELTNNRIRITAVGDIMCSPDQYKDAYDSDIQSYNFNYVFDEVKPYLRLSDITIGNLETTFSGEDNRYGQYNAPAELGTSLKNMGFDVLTTANDHSLDKGFAGVTSTINSLETIGISHTGTFRTGVEKDRVIIKDAKGVKIAFLAYTMNSIGKPENDFCINLADKEKMLSDISKAKEQKADVILVNMHWGKWYNQTISNEQIDLENFLFQNGVDVIIGSNQHVLQKMEKKQITTNDGVQKDVFVAYSLGNFISSQNIKYTNLSVILNIDFERQAGTDKVVMNDISYRPIYMLKDLKSKDKKYMILDIKDSIKDYEDKEPGAVDKKIYNELKKGLEDIYKLTKF